MPPLPTGTAISTGADVGLLIDGLACVILAIVVMEDVRRFRIRNVWILSLVALFAMSSFVGNAGNSALWHILLAAIVLVTMLVAFQLHLLGAGDAKLLSAASLWIGPEGAITFAVVLFASTILYCGGAMLNALPKRRAHGKIEIPFAPSIAGAWLATIAFTYI